MPRVEWIAPPLADAIARVPVTCAAVLLSINVTFAGLPHQT